MPPLPFATASSRCCLSASTTSTKLTQATAIHATRSLHTTSPHYRQKPSYLTVPSSQVPDYPYGPFRTYKQANQGLFAGTKTRFGNVVAERYGNKSRTRWLPNRHTKRLWSPALKGFVRTRLTTRVLRTIDLLGGIDEYLLGNKAQRIKDLGPAGWALRWKIMQTDVVRERFNRERVALGLPLKEQGFPSELTAEGVTPDEVMREVDGMLERGDEFVIGEVGEGEEAAAEAIQEAVEEAARDIETKDAKTLRP